MVVNPPPIVKSLSTCKLPPINALSDVVNLVTPLKLPPICILSANVTGPEASKDVTPLKLPAIVTLSSTKRFFSNLALPRRSRL